MSTGEIVWGATAEADDDRSRPRSWPDRSGRTGHDCAVAVRVLRTQADLTEDECALIAELAPRITYGWGMIPVTVRIGASDTTTSLWPKDGGYIVPLKKSLRESEGLELGDKVEVSLVIAT